MIPYWVAAGYAIALAFRTIRLRRADAQTPSAPHWADDVTDPGRRLQGRCGLCGRWWTYRHPVHTRTARVYHALYDCPVRARQEI